jgi:fatty-acyl-CoA synthase
MDISFLLRQPLSPGSRVDPDAPALGEEDQTPLSYRELAERVNTYANALLSLGVVRGDRVGLLLYNSVEYWLSYLATTRIGAIAVRLNFRLTGPELEYVVGDSGCSVLMFAADLAQRVESIRSGLSVAVYVIAADDDVPGPPWARPWSVLDEGSPSEPPEPVPQLDDPAMIMYSSGTTGRPKGALWTHGNSAWFSAMQLAEWGFGAGTTVLVCGPLYHVGGIEDFCLPTLFAGGRVIFMRSRGFTAQRAVQVAERQGATDIALFPAMIYQLLESDVAEAVDLSRARRIFTGGDPVLPWATERLRELYPWVDLVQVYGLTEGTPIAACGGPGLAFQDPISVGRAMPFGQLSIRDEAGIEISAGAEGEIWTMSPANCAAYWNQPEATAATFIDGWCRTGDLGKLTGTGLVITGRKKDMIRSGGENIYPAEIEDVLARHPKIRDVAVIGVPDPVFIETVCAVIVVAGGASLSEDEVVEHCLRHLARYKKPRHVRFVDELPRTASSKIQKYRLREQFADPLTRPRPQ